MNKVKNQIRALIVIGLVVVFCGLAGLFITPVDDELLGEWTFYGTLPANADYQSSTFDKGDIETLNEILEYTDAIPGDKVTITHRGVKEYLKASNENYSVVDWVKKDKNRYCLTLDIKKPADTKANVPDHIIQNIYYTKIEDLLYEEVSYENADFSPVEIIVYKKSASDNK